MTKQEAINKHRQMWRWIAEKTEERRKAVNKIDYFNETGQMLGKPKNLCWCCEYAQSIDKDFRRMCDNCPIQWKTDWSLRITPCCDRWSEYTVWDESVLASNWRKAACWAKIIAELPERG